MIVTDCHIHLMTAGAPCDPGALNARMQQAGISGGILLSLPPAAFPFLTPPTAFPRRLEKVLDWTRNQPTLHPFFWIDPTEPDAVEQVAQCVQAGIEGFKVICNHFAPGDSRAMRTFRCIASAGRPILFHSGILWDGMVSSPFNRPAEFEALLDVPRLRFALAHIAWPWCDELIAVFGKFLNAASLRGSEAPVMFVDTTPGTPEIYREDALHKLFFTGYPVEHRVVFGLDCRAENYDVHWSRIWLERDRSILAKLKVDTATAEAYLGGNLDRFIKGD